jgi:hypothetical protein
MAAFALFAFFSCMNAACFDQSGGGKAASSIGGISVNSAAALKEYLVKQPANSPDKPIKVTMKVDEMTLNQIVEVLFLS